MTIVAPVLKTEICRLLFEKWLAARGDRLLPRRPDIDLFEIKAILPWIAIIEGREPGVAMFRLAGTNYRDILGFEPTGRNLIDLTPAPVQRLRSYRIHTLMIWPCAGLAEVGVRFSSGISDSYEFLALPLDAERTEGEGIAFCAVASISGERWQNQRSAGSVIGAPAEAFQFVDIGAGIPPSLEPPDDFLPP